MYNVKRIDVWECETKMSRDWLPPPLGGGVYKKGAGQDGSVISNLGPEVDIPVTAEGAK